MKRLLTYLTVLLSLAAATTATAQSDYVKPALTLEETVVAPEAKPWAFPVYESPQVDPGSGTGSMAVNLFSWNVGKYAMDISLGYALGGHTLDEKSGIVGLGWKLNCLGVVYRDIVGLPDEKVPFSSLGNQEVWALEEQNPAKGSTLGGGTQYLDDLTNYKKEAMYDRYHYQFPGHSGSFIIRDGLPVLLPADNVSITLFGEAGTDKVRDFRITVPDGTVYEFTEREHINYIHNPVSYDNTNPLKYYNAVNKWHLSRIITPGGCDTITYSYTTLPMFNTSRNHNSESVGVVCNETYNTHEYAQNGGSATFAASSTIQTLDCRIPDKIVSRTATVTFSHAKRLGTEEEAAYLTGFTVSNPDGINVREVTLTAGTIDNGLRRTLNKVKVTSGGEMLDSIMFSYHKRTGVLPGDFFGYANGVTSFTYGSVIDSSTGRFNTRRLYKASSADHGALAMQHNAAGLRITYEYEPNTMVRPEYGDSIQIGVRIKSIKAHDLATGRNVIRSFSYSDPVCDIDFSKVDLSAFVSLSGLHWLGYSNAGFANVPMHNVSASALRSSRLPGAPLSGAHIYYGKAAEEISGTGIEKPVRTEYEYDTSRCSLPFVWDGNSSPTSNQYYIKGDMTLPSPAMEDVSRMFSAGFATYYFAECQYAVPVLKVRREMAWNGAEYATLTEKEYFHSLKDSAAFYTGTFYESLVKDIKDIYSRYKHTYKSPQDFNFYRPVMLTGRWRLDSVCERRFYGRPGKRIAHQQTTAYRYSLRLFGSSGDNVQWAKPGNIPWPPFFTNRAANGGIPSIDFQPQPLNGYNKVFGDSIWNEGLYELPVATVMRSGQHTAQHHIAYIDQWINRKDMTERALPVAEMWITDGDTLLKRYEYGTFHSLTRPTRITLGIKGAPSAAERRFTAYSPKGHPLNSFAPGEPDIRYTWGFGGDLPASISVGPADSPITTTYNHIPLVGCTYMKSPHAPLENFVYSGSRLTKRILGLKETLEEYSYTFRSGSSPNTISVTSHAAATSLSIQSSETAVTKEYHDGFGTRVGTLMEGYGNGSDVLSAVKHDALGRVLQQWQPFPSSNPSEMLGSNSANRLGNAANDALGDARAYTEFAYPFSAEAEAASTTLAGSAFAGHPATSEKVCSNPVDSELKVRRLCWNGSTLRCNGYYSAGELTGVKETDADGVAVITFTDALGRMVLRRALGDAGKQADTYTVSDSWGNPLLVLQPMGSAMLADGATYTASSDILDSFAFIFRYDSRLRVRSRKMPGCAPELTAYDTQGRVLYSRDAQIAAKGRRYFHIQDAYGRTVLNGTCPDFTRESDWSLEHTPVTAVRGAGTSATAQFGYSLSAPLPTGAVVTEALYYDTYPEPLIGTSELPLNRKGVMTARKCAVLVNGEPHGYATTEYHYDLYVRNHLTYEKMPSGALITTLCTFTRGGWERSRSVTLDNPDGSSRSVATACTYDPFGKVLSVTASLDGGPEIMLAQNSYDSTGRLTMSLAQGGVTNSFAYDVRGALTSASNRFVSQSYSYASGSNPSYAGRISRKSIRTKHYSFKGIAGRPKVDNSDFHRTEYEYDLFGRLAKATVYGKTNSESIPIRPVGIQVPTVVLPGGTELTEILPEIASETFTYDLNANITRLLRKAVWGLKSTPAAADDLTMAYDGNRLSSLTDNAGEVLSEALPDIPSGAYSGNDFRYDAAGCVTRDMARGITHMAYHRPGIPARMETASGDSIVFVYTAAGKKLSETVFRSGVPTKREYAGPWELVDGKIDRVNLGQGYFDSSGTFHAYIRDIAANIIGVYRAEEDADEVEQHNEFFAYGSPTGISNTLITGADKNRRKHTGKEFISELGVDSYDFSARFLAPLTGRFDSPDPKAWDYTWLSPYTFCAADPINNSDPTGERIKAVAPDRDGNAVEYFWEERDGVWNFYDSSGTAYSGNDEFMTSLTSAMGFLMEGEAGYGLVSSLVNNDIVMQIWKSKGESYASINAIRWNPNGNQIVPTTEGEQVSNEATLGHELAHIKYNWDGGKQEPWMVTNGKQINISEIYTTHIENQIRAEHNLPLRTFYKKINGVRWDYRDRLINADGTSRFVNSKGVVFYSPLNKKSQPYRYIK